MNYTLDEFKEIWNGTSANDILNQFYHEHIELRKALKRIADLQQENERLNKLKYHYQRYRNENEEQQEVYDILELGKMGKNLHKHKNTGGLNWIDLPMTKFSSISSYIRARDLALEDYKSRCEKAIELLNKRKNEVNEDLWVEMRAKDYFEECDEIIYILQNGSDTSE